MTRWSALQPRRRPPIIDRCTSPNAIHRLGALLGSATLVVALVTLGSTGTSAAATVVLRPVVSGLVAPDLRHEPQGRHRPAVRRRAARQDPGRQERRPAADPVPRHLGHGRLRRRAGPARARVPPELQDERRRSTSTSPARAATRRSTQYKVSSTNPDVAVRTSSRRLLTIDQPYTNHNGGMLAFGPTATCTSAIGDGGGSGDPGNNAQNVNALLGKILRINVNGTTGGIQYRIPASNPYVGRTGRDEIWSLGLRNPWRFSFDRANGRPLDRRRRTGEVRGDRPRRRRPASGYGRGLNFGWRVMEGRHCYSPSSGCNTSGKTAAGRRVQPLARAAR